MCGLTGIFHFDSNRDVDKTKLNKITDTLIHRGPDGEGYFVDNNIGLGHRRLSIIDLETGNQPMYSPDGKIVIVFNGEIYNYIELKSDLIKKGYKFKTKSDTEIIINSYLEWGIECQNKLNGMWAFAIWDARKKQLFLSRDRIGEKPLHYAKWDNSFIFASEIKSILEYGVPREPRIELLEIYLVLKSIPAPHSFYKNIFKLMPGHYILVDKDGFREHKYWDLPVIDEKNMLSNTNLIYDEFEYLLEDSTKIRMRADVPFGAFLSGGLDSSCIASLMTKNSNYPIKTFTIGYDDEEFDESSLANLVSEKFGTEHYLGLAPPSNFEEYVKKSVNHYDEPFGDPSSIPTGHVSKLASENVKMVLTGDGGDEILSGYPSYLGVELAKKYKVFPSFIKKSLSNGLKATSRLFRGKYRYKINRLQNISDASMRDFNESLLIKRAKPNLNLTKLLLNSNISIWRVEDFLNDFMKDCPYEDDFYKLMYFNFKFDLPNGYLVKVDRMSMAHSLETRIPFLDFRLIEFMCGVDKKVKIRNHELKSILKNTIGNNLPSDILNAPKRGFNVPVRDWLKSGNHISSLYNSFSQSSIFNSKILKKIIRDNSTSQSDNGSLLWSLIILENYIEN